MVELTIWLAKLNPVLLSSFHFCIQLCNCTQQSFTLWQTSWSALSALEKDAELEGLKLAMSSDDLYHKVNACDDHLPVMQF